MKPFFLFVFLLLAVTLTAQNNCYRDLRKQGLSLLAKKDYRKAIDKLFAARYCPDKPAKDDLDNLIKKTQDAWVKELNDTKKAAQDALQQLQAATAQTVTLFLKEIDQHILKLEYDQAREKTAIALTLNAQKKEVVKRLQEVAFFYTETNQLVRADSVLQLLNNKPNLSQRLALLKTIQNLNLTYYDTLQKRYYPEMVNVEGGTFMMGNDNGDDEEKPAHQVTLSSFQMAKTETTVWQYNLFVVAMNKPIEAPDWEAPGWGWWGDNPMVNVSWYDALEYVNWLSEKLDLQVAYTIDKINKDTLNESALDNVKWMMKMNVGHNGFRLPTEAEWEFTARGGNLEKDKNFTYAGGNELDELGWHEENAKSRTQPVAQKMPNVLGLYDLSGNVWEWCSDWYDAKYYAESGNSNGPSTGKYRVLRSGSWYNVDSCCRGAYRSWGSPSIRYVSYGFRLAQDK